jgi:hypothetical protein
MDRLKLETAYLRALDVLMSAVDECQLQVAIFRLRRAQARLHGRGTPGTHYLAHRGLRRGYPVDRAGRPVQLFGIRLELQDFKANEARSPHRH